MARRATLINRLSKGELDPALSEALDLQHYYNSVKRGENVVFTPQGGVNRRFTTMVSRPRLRRRLEPVPLTSGMLTAHNGGTKDNLIDEDPETEFTTNAVGSSTFVVIEVDLGTPMPIVFVDLIGFRCANNVLLDNAVIVEWWDGSEWVPLSGPEDQTLSPRRHLRSSNRNRRFGAAPGVVTTAQSWRVVVYNGEGGGAITLRRLRFWGEKGLLSPFKVIDFAKSSDENYQLVLTDRNIDVFDNGTFLSSIAVDIAPQQIAEVSWAQSQDTLIVFHADLTTLHIVRQGSPVEWNSGWIGWENVPSLTSDQSFSGEQDEVQDISFSNLDVGQKIVLFFNTSQCAPITFADSGSLPDQIIAALSALPEVAENVPEVTEPPEEAAPAEINLIAELRSVSPLTVRLRFTGENGGRAWPPVFAVLLENDADTSTTTVVQRGIDPDGLLFSDSTGWPRCGVLRHGRLLVGGMRSAPQTVAASRVGAFDFTTEEPGENGDPPLITADMAFVDTFDTDQIETIRAIFNGRHLQVFTETGEWWLENRTLDATQPRNWILATRNGAAPNVRPAFGENATLFIQKGGQTLRDFLYSDVAQNYEAEPLSLLAPHRLTDVIAMAYRPASSTSEPNLISLINRDGTFALLSLLRAQEVVAISGCATPHGLVRDAVCDTAGRIWMGVERGDRTTLEVAYDGTLDAAVSYSGAPITVLNGLDHLEGLEVWAWADGDLVGPLTVDDGEITLPAAASEVIAGLAVFPDIITQDLREKITQERPFKPPARVYEVELSLVDTGQALVSANSGPLIECALRHWDGAPLPALATGDEPANDHFDVPLMQRLFSGQTRLEGLEGFTEHARIRVTQSVPAPFKLRAIRYEISY